MVRGSLPLSFFRRRFLPFSNRFSKIRQVRGFNYLRSLRFSTTLTCYAVQRRHVSFSSFSNHFRKFDRFVGSIILRSLRSSSRRIFFGGRRPVCLLSLVQPAQLQATSLKQRPCRRGSDSAPDHASCRCCNGRTRRRSRRRRSRRSGRPCRRLAANIFKYG
jgi:hypothetical protein